MDKYLCVVEVLDKNQLESMHTKQLLKELRNTYAGICCDTDWCENGALCKHNHDENVRRIKEILATRPHIPNKQESKAMRIAKIKKGV